MNNSDVGKISYILVKTIALMVLSGASMRGWASDPVQSATVTISSHKEDGVVLAKADKITLTVNGFSETLTVPPHTANASIASTLAAIFSRDFHDSGLDAKAGEAGTESNVITFRLAGDARFDTISTTSSGQTLFKAEGFRINQSAPSNSGMITLFVNSSAVSSTMYGNGSTAASVASGLTSTPLSSPVTVSSSGSSLTMVSKQSGAGTTYPYYFSVTYDAQDYTGPSFKASPASGSLAGGADAGTFGSTVINTVYGYSIINPADGTSGYDVAGNINFMTDSVMGQWHYGYDSLNELSLATASAGPYTASTLGMCWNYDGFGNRLHASTSNQAFPSDNGGASSVCTKTGSATFMDVQLIPGYNNNRIQALVNSNEHEIIIPFFYDGAGNLTNDGVYRYLYDAENRLCAVQGSDGMTGYQYDAQGVRVGKGSITSMSCDLSQNGYQPIDEYVLDQKNAQMTEMTNQGGSMAWAHTNVQAGGMLLATYDQVGLHFYLNDALGSRRVQTDAAGNIEQTCQSLPFGDQLNCSLSISAPTEHHFTGKERDAESGLDYFGARYYASSMGRFMSPDWADKPEAVPYSSLDNPQSLNLYGYVLNNPLSKADADGHDCCQAFKDFMSGAGGAVGSNNTAGISPRDTPDSTAGRAGALFGDALSAVQGGLEIAVAVGGEAGGLALDATGVGAIAGVPINVGAAAVGVHGTATLGASIVAMGRGSYTNSHESGKTYSGKGDASRASDSAKSVEGKTGDKHISTDHKTAASDRQSFKDEHQRIQQNGGAGSNKNYNKIESPGKKYSQQDGSK